MSLFGKSQMTSEVDTLDFEANNGSSNPSKFSFTRTHSVKPKYGIDKAISLVRSLQKHKINPSVIAGIMKQTLESVDIHFTDIIADAKRKETDIHNDNEAKDKQVEAMKRKFEALKNEKLKLQQDLDETISVREFLQQVISENPKQQESIKPINSEEKLPEFIERNQAVVN